MTKLQIEEVYKRDWSNPLLLKFQNGYPTDKFKTTDCCLLTKNTERNEKHRSVVTALDGIIYSGDENNEQLGKTLIVARNKKTGKARIIEMTCAELKPLTKADLDRTQAHDTSNLELSRKFGSKKQKQQMEQREKLKINIDTVTEQMKTVTENVVVNKLDLTLYTNTNSDDMYIPPINKEATRVEDVYDVKTILTEEQYERIHSEISEKDYNTGLLPLVKSITDRRTLSANQTVLALYASGLLKIYLTQSKDLSKKSFIACPISTVLNDIIMSNFTLFINNRRTRPSTLKDKALCHAIVIMLLLSNFKIELDSLAATAKITAATASTKARAVGAHIVTNADKKYIQLKIPLNTNTGFKRRKSAKF